MVLDLHYDVSILAESCATEAHAVTDIDMHLQRPDISNGFQCYRLSPKPTRFSLMYHQKGITCEKMLPKFRTPPVTNMVYEIGLISFIERIGVEMGSPTRTIGCGGAR
jgi:hypothetical protein